MRRRKRAGFTLLMVVFMVAAMLIIVAAAAPNLLTEGRRQKEEEMVWRGQQYARAIGLYYRKFGKYPTRVEDMTRQTNGVRFLREPYTDPMNKDDGSWRFIYVGPNGQLIGSVRQTTLLQNTLSIPGLGGISSFGGMQPLAPPAATTAGTNPQAGAPGAGAPGQPATNPAAAANPLESQPQPLMGDVLGGNIIGVGSKIKKPSLRVYMGGDTYEKWEFIWNPVGQAIPGQAGANPNATPGASPTGAAPGLNPFGANPIGGLPGGANPNPLAGQQPSPNQQTPIINMPPPTQ
jgi:type II secretory pathway pseudopilin PulG